VPPIMHTQHLSFVRSIGRNIKHLIDRPDEDYCFRLHKDRVYYVSEAVMRKATCVNRKQLMSVGTCFGKFTKTLKFRLHITALDYISQYAKYKVWVKPSSELSYLYGNNVLKAGLGRITENTPQYQVMNLRLELEIIIPSMLDWGAHHGEYHAVPDRLTFTSSTSTANTIRRI
jgi:ribosome biogenesis protein Nip4